MFIWTYRRRAYVSSPRYEFIECIMNYNKGKFYQINYWKLKIYDLLYLYFLFQKCSLNLEFDSLLKGSKVFALKMKLLKIVYIFTDMNRMINGKERFESAMYICIFDQQRPRSSVKVDNYLCFSSVDSVPPWLQGIEIRDFL